MSREGANNRIDSLKNTLNTDHYSRNALGNAVRFNTMLSVLDDFSIVEEQNKSNGIKTKFSLNDFANSLERTVGELRTDFDEQLNNDEFNNVNRRFDSENTIQQKLSNTAYKTSLGQTVAHSTVQRKGMYQDFNTSYSTGATGAFRAFTNGFVQDDEDFFGSRVLYDNVFGQYEDGSESLSNKARIAASDPTNDIRTVSEKVLDNIVNKSIYDQTEIVDRVDIEFGRFHGNSMIDQMSMTGSGLKAARQTIRTVMQEGSAYGRQVEARGTDNHPIVLAQALSDRTGNDIETVNSALNLLNNNLGNRSTTTTGPDGGYVNKAGVAEFIDLINTAGTRDANGSLTGGKISISTFQFQNETISAALSDKIQRHVLESVLQGGGAPLEIDVALAFPRQRNLDKRQDQDGRYAVGMTNYAILGPNLIEALKLEEVKNNVQDMLLGLGISKEDITKYVNFNVGFRDKKFHPKVYLTDNVASIGTQNLTAPVGSSVNQAGSNFETMRFVTNVFKDDDTLNSMRQGFTSVGSKERSEITQSLLYRQISDVVDQERLYNDKGNLNRALGSTTTPILNNKTNSQVGFAGDIYQHLSNTLDFAHRTSFGNSLSSSGLITNQAANNSVHMFMVLDQSFMLQLGSNSAKGLLDGEMGAEIGSPYSKENIQAQRYKTQQNKLFDLLITDRANIVVDTKNFERQVLKPLLEKINEQDKETGVLKNQKLKSNFEKYGQSFSMMAGFDLLKPVGNSSSDEYKQSLNVMFKELRRLGFTKEAGFEEDDLKQIIGLASNNIERANVPKQHAKEFGLFDYSRGSAELISYYQGSSNMGLYSLGIESGEDGRYMPGDGDLTNTEIGIMLGRRDINNNLSRSTQNNLRLSSEYANEQSITKDSINLWSLNEEEEAYELGLAQRHFSTTWNQLARSSIDTIKNKNFVSSSPTWQDNVNTKDLLVLRKRLETMSKDLGLSSDVFNITERYGNRSGDGITSINVSIDMNRIMSSTEFMKGTNYNLPRLNFELSVLQGPSRGEGMFYDSAENGDVSGYVYFVDKNRVIGNGLFTNDSGQDISVLGRHNYEDDFVSDIHKGRVSLKSGQSAHMSSLDIVPQLFATLMGEAVNRFGTKESMKIFDTSPANESNFNMRSVKDLLMDYVAISLTGYSTQMDESIKEGSNIVSAMKQIQNNLNVVSLQDLNQTIHRHMFSKDNEMDSGLYNSKDPIQFQKERNNAIKGLQDLNNKWFHKLKGGRQATEGDVEFYLNDLFELAQKSPQLANMIVKTAYKDPNQTSKIQGFKEFQTLLFGSFLQTKDERTYGGQQGFYKTLLMGVGNSTLDKNTAGLMFDVDERDGLHNLNAYARFKPLEYNPLTDIHDVLYRSIASKSTSMTKNDSGLDSIMFESEARDLGDAGNLRLLSSLGIGTVLHRDRFIEKNSEGQNQLGKDQKEIFEAMERAMIASGSDVTAINTARQMYLDSVAQEFGNLDSEDRKDTIRLRFYTGSSKKLSQLPQRIKNAMGARPMYQFSIDAQMALERGESLNELSDNYLQQHRQPIVQATKKKVEFLLNERERLVALYGEEHERVVKIDAQIDDLKIIGSKAFNNKVAGLGAIFSGRIKSILNQEQVNFITKTKERLYNSVSDLIADGELSQNVLDELIRVEILKAGLTNKGLGKMITGNDHMNYGMALIQLSGSYNDTSLNNPLYGTVYHSKEKYERLRKHEIDIYDNSLSALDRDRLGIYTLGMQEGHFDAQQESIKSSMIGAGGMEVLLQQDDIIVEDKNTGGFVHKRKVNGEWKIVGQVDESRTVQSVRNVIDRTGFSEVGSSSIGSSTMSAYGRKGEGSTDYIYTSDNRAGVFANNEYLLTFDRIRAMQPGSARRVEGTDSGALIKAVAVFAGRVKYSSIQGDSLVNKEMNVFENIEDQIMKSYAAGEVKGSLKSYLDARDETQRVTLQDGRTGYAPLSSSIHGLYNANNFKSFFWSHGATILRAQNNAGKSFMLDGLFDTSTDKQSVDSAKKLAASLLVNFGTDFLQQKEGSNSQENITQLKRSLVTEMVRGEFGSHYQILALETTRTLGGRVEEIFNNPKLRKGRNKEQIVSDLVYEKVGNQVGFNASKIGALSAISANQLNAVMAGDTKASTDLLNLVRQGIMDPVAKQAQAVGGINFDNSAHTQAALIVTAVDLMHQISGQGSKLRIPSDVDFDSDKVKDIFLTLIGSTKSINDEETEDIMQFLSGVNTNVSTISVFTDIIFSYSKDPTSTQSVARHEGQHLITPFLGDIKKYQEGGKLSNIQHTVASITAMVTGQASGMLFYDQMSKNAFGEKKALNLTSKESDYLFTSFNKATYLGFYQSGVSGATTDNYVKEYKSINKLLLAGDYDWDSIQTVRDANDRTKFAAEDQGRLDFDQEGKPGSTAKAYAQVERFVNKFHANESELQKARRVDYYLMMGGDKFALHQMNELTTMMSIENARYQADPSKSTGRDTVSNLLESMTNKREFFSLPELSFEMQNGEIITRASNSKLISTMLPSAEEMRVLGAEYADFVDPILGHYKNLAAIFVPGSIANTAFEKVRLAARDNRAIVLSTEEYKAMSSVMDSARMMVPELAKASASSRTQEAFAGKSKYQGFTSTGIGNLLMPFDSVALAQSKLDEVGMTENLERFELMRQSDLSIQAVKEDRSYYISDNFKAQEREGSGPVNTVNKESKSKKPNSLLEDIELRYGKDSIEYQQTVAINTNNLPLYYKLKEQSKILETTSTKSINALGKNIINFHRRQKAAEAFGISKALEKDFDIMKKEAVEVKNKILGLANIATLNDDERLTIFNALYEEIKHKRDVAYAMSSIDESTGDSVSNRKNAYSKKTPTEADKYIYHAQALNYDALLASISLIGHQAKLVPLSTENVKDLERKKAKLGEVEFLLNSNQDKDSGTVFYGLGTKQSNLSEGALFVNRAISPDGGMVGQHMKAINSLSSEMRKLGMSTESKNIKTQYAVQQIEATIQMYQKRMDDMQKFSAERSVHSSKRNEKGELIIDEAVQRKIDTASNQYNENTRKVIAYLEDKKSKIMSGTQISDQDIRNTFEDIDVKIAEVDTANISLAEVFRSPPPGGTDPRIHTYRVMQGVAALNSVSNMLSDNKQIGSENKMTYSTERGQTATMLASLGVVTLGGGDYDGDPYTVILHQAADMQKLIQQKQSKVDQNQLMLNNLVKATEDIRNQINQLNVRTGDTLKQRERLEERLSKLEKQVQEHKANLFGSTAELNDAKRNFERQIADGHKGLQARARKQLANQMGMDERLLVHKDEFMYDTNGRLVLDEQGRGQKGLNVDKTYDADSMMVLLEKGYNLMEGVQSKNGMINGMMETMDALTGYKSQPDVFRNGEFLKELVSGDNLIRTDEQKISSESPAIGMLKNRVVQLQNSSQHLTNEQQQFVNNLKDVSTEHYIAYLEQFDAINKSMESALALHNQENLQKAEDKRKEFSARAFMNQWIGGNIYSSVVGDTTLGKFMTQGGGMTLTEGSFDMTLKTLGKAGGEVLGKTYNTIIGSTFQDAPVISYGRQMLDSESELHKATRTEFQNQMEGNTEKRAEVEAEMLSRGFEKGTPEFNKAVSEELRSIGYSQFDEYIKVTQKAVLKSEGTQGFMKNIHQLLRDSIKLKGDGDLLRNLEASSEEYDTLSKQIAMNDEKGGGDDVRKDLLSQRDAIISKMASNLGPGPGLKSLIDLDYLTNESSKTGMSKNDFESRFLTKGGIDSNRQMLAHYANSMDNLTEEERSHLLDPSSITEESGALLKVARNMTANNIAAMVTSFRMDATAVEGRTEGVKSWAASHKAKLATQLGHHTAVKPEGVMQDGVVGGEDETGKYIKEKYGVIEAEHNGAKFDVNRQHKNALGAHLGIEEAHLYNDDGTMSEAYRDKLEKASKKLNLSTEEYVLMFDIHNETSREQVKGVFGEDGKEMEQFTVMNMMRKNIARSMMDGRIPGADASKIINESMGSEVLTTMAQLAAQNKLDSKGMEVFSGMYKGVVGYMLEATDGVVDVTRKSDGTVIQMRFNEMNQQQKSAYMTKLLHQQMLGTAVDQEGGFTRSTSQASRDFKSINARVIANSNLVIDDTDGTLNGKLGNEFIDALDKAGAQTLTGQQQEMYEAMSDEFIRSSIDNDEQFDSLMRLSLPSKGDTVAGRKSDAEYRSQMKKKVRAQMKIRQEQDSKKYAASRSRHNQGRSVMNRSSFMNNINTSALDQLSTTASSNALDLFVPLALTAVGSVIQDGSVDGEKLMGLGGAMFTAFQYARTGTIESTTLEPDEYKKRLMSASAVGGIFKFKNALARTGDENVGEAIASLAIQEVTAAAFNTIATPWLSRNIAEHGLGVKHGPALSSLDMKKYQAGQQLAGNLGASLISAVSSTLISGLFMKGVESISHNVGDVIQSFLPAAQAVSSVNEAIAKRRQQEAAYEDFEAETDNSEGEVRDYMVMTDATYDPNDYNSMADLQEAQEIEPSNDGSLSIGLLG